MLDRVEGEEVGREFRLLRKARGLTQQQLSDLSTVSVRTIRDLECGRVHHPRHDTLRLLADALRLSETRRAFLSSSFHGDPFGSLKIALERGGDPLPVADRALFGRDTELASLMGLLGSTHRLTALVGIAGVGKTQLAAAAVRSIRGREDGTLLWISAVGDAEADALNQPTRSACASRLLWNEEGLEVLAALVEDQSVIFVLDGFDLEFSLAERLTALLLHCPALRVLCVGRAAPALSSSGVLALAPLPDPAVSDDALKVMTTASDHVAVSDACRPQLAQVCRALDGLPMALEAAGSWLSMYSPPEMLEISRECPVSLTYGAFESPGAGGLAVALADSMMRLSERHADLLREIVETTSPWAMRDVESYLGEGRTGAVRAVKTLLQQGLIRRVVSGGSGSKFEALNLLRHVVSDGCACSHTVSATPE